MKLITVCDVACMQPYSISRGAIVDAKRKVPLNTDTGLWREKDRLVSVTGFCDQLI